MPDDFVDYSVLIKVDVRALDGVDPRIVVEAALGDLLDAIYRESLASGGSVLATLATIIEALQHPTPIESAT